ncbi:hypothetical protein [Leekyejoonella antrihumi]|uniref:Serine hydrolase n=1 Tax=Leekyejoonella antrihumi TaxID=1660198 RepID=A0A563DZB1_9MICO|nr:hypothetical protein [Leekyejoonella antrihumi]TWP35535.1 hypothetical protein FGL98_13195 [Leekyejoonella antrihumi]
MKRMAIGTTLAVMAAAVGTALVPGMASATPHTSNAPIARVAHVSATGVPGSSARSVSTNKAITAAVLHSRLLGDVPASDVTVSAIRLHGSWAGAVATPRDGRTDPAQVLLHRVGSAWTVTSLGSYEVGCGAVSSTVRHQLGLHGECG